MNQSRDFRYLHTYQTIDPLKKLHAEDIGYAKLAYPIRRYRISKKALITARVGQGRFKDNVRARENFCRITGVSNGSHIKPWRHSSNDERLDGENGLLLTPSIDHLFDRGHISFKNNGSLLISPSADRESLAKMGVRDEDSAIIKPFSQRQQHHLEFHRDRIFTSRGY